MAACASPTEVVPTVVPTQTPAPRPTKTEVVVEPTAIPVEPLEAALSDATLFVQSPGPETVRSDAPLDGGVAWPSGDELRRELQDIGFTFRIERDSGDWLGWAPRASIVEAPAVTLGGAGSEDARVRFGFELLQTDLFGADVDAALTALMEIAARLPLNAARADQMRRFVVDDLLVTAAERVREAAALGAANTLLVKPNQRGTLTETKAAFDAARQAGFGTIVSARSGETEDTTIVHLAVGWEAGQLKVGSFARSERMAKWNEALRIEEALGKRARFAGRAPFQKPSAA